MLKLYMRQGSYALAFKQPGQEQKVFSIHSRNNRNWSYLEIVSEHHDRFIQGEPKQIDSNLKSEILCKIVLILEREILNGTRDY